MMSNFNRNLVVPMRWPMDSSSDEADSEAEAEVDPVNFLSKPLASLSLWDEPQTSSTTNR